MIAIRSMGPDFQNDIFWTSSVRPKLAQRLSAVAVGGEISKLSGPHSLYVRDSYFIHRVGFFIHPEYINAAMGVRVNKYSLHRGFEPLQESKK